MKSPEPVLSVVIPVYNEAAVLALFHKALMDVFGTAPLAYEVIYVNDGSTDRSLAVLREVAETDEHVRILNLSRNFGKEMATTAGLHAARGEAILMLDADGQHPVEVIPKFVQAWRQGAKVVVGMPSNRRSTAWKRAGSKLFNGMYGRLTGIKIEQNATDFRLIDREVQASFNRLTEHNRITRGLIDWLGYERRYVSYTENERLAGNSTQSFRKLFKLAIDSAISLSTSPLYLVAYIGVVVLPVATVLGIGMLVNYVLRDPLHLHATGGAYVMVLLLFLIGILLVSQGIIGLYLSHIHAETQNRPLYVVDELTSERKA